MAIVKTIYKRLLQSYGPQLWWPAETEFEVMVGAVLTQHTSWTNVEKSITSLNKKNALHIEAIMQMPETELSTLIRPSGFHRVKAKTLISLATLIHEQYDGSVEKLKKLPSNKKRIILLGVKGIGPETADDILLYALKEPCFVIDEYTKRIFKRVGKTPNNGSYNSWQKMLDKEFKGSLNEMREYHALLVVLGKNHCKSDPNCTGCPLVDICVYGSSHMSAS